MGDYYECERSYSIELVKAELTNFDMRPTILPHTDINFKFFCKSKLSEWVIIHEQDSTKTRVLVRELNRPVMEKVVPEISYQQFVRHNQTCRPIWEVLGQLVPLADDEERQNMMEFALVRAREIVKYKMLPTCRNVLDLHFNVTEQHDHVFDGINNIDESSSESYSYCMVRPAVKSLKRKRIDSSGDESCCICLEDLSSCGKTSFEGLISMPCSHVFHGDCITQWLRTSHYCPICRFEMPTTN
ncbi:hypothetical protein DH2020_022934 [Rehmannia glutinosa]|uniref:RING-type E3 ubiquitin transferase n=1 Tax=Rehmannia glutinosa TaxID=99300 RepID=A0ABR0W783_REHGL